MKISRPLLPQSGFSLIELVLVVVVLGILSSVAIPKLVAPNETVLSAEGRQTLMVLMAAQKRYFLDTGQVGYSNNMAQLDVIIPASPYFNVPTLGGVAGSLASAQRNGAPPNDYTLTIDTDGNITCAPAASCLAPHCNQQPGGNRCN